MSDGHMMRVTVFSAEQYDSSFPCPRGTRLVEFERWLAGKISEIPEEYREQATIDLDTRYGHEDSSYVTVEIEYRRPETEGEASARLAKADAAARSLKDTELALLAALKKKYNA